MSMPETLGDLVVADAREFGFHARQGGWRLGLLVARSVVKGAGGQGRHEGIPIEILPGKVSATQFAEMSGTSPARVLRHLEAWERAAADEIVPHADTLLPGDEVDLDLDRLPAWEKKPNVPGGYYDAREKISFLDEAAQKGDYEPDGQPVGGEKGPRDTSRDGYTPSTYVWTMEQRAVVFKAINLRKKTPPFPESSAALYEICAEWLAAWQEPA